VRPTFRSRQKFRLMTPSANYAKFSRSAARRSAQHYASLHASKRSVGFDPAIADQIC